MADERTIDGNRRISSISAETPQIVLDCTAIRDDKTMFVIATTICV